MSKTERLRRIEEAQNAGLSYYERTVYSSVSSVYSNRKTSIVICDTEFPPIPNAKQFHWWYARFRDGVSRLSPSYKSLLRVLQGDPARFLSLSSVLDPDEIDQFVKSATHRGNVEIGNAE